MQRFPGKNNKPKGKMAPNCNSCTFSLNFGAFIPNAAQLYTNLAAGTYYVTAKDANGNTQTIVVTIINAPVSTALLLLQDLPAMPVMAQSQSPA